MMKGASNFDKLCHQVFDGKNDGTNYLARETKYGLAPGPITRPPQSWRYVEEETWND